MAKPFIRKACWRKGIRFVLVIGSVKQTFIWNDPWLPDKVCFFIETDGPTRFGNGQSCFPAQSGQWRCEEPILTKRSMIYIYHHFLCICFIERSIYWFVWIFLYQCIFVMFFRPPSSSCSFMTYFDYVNVVSFTNSGQAAYWTPRSLGLVFRK